MIELCRRQLSFGDGLIAEEVGDLWEDWMRHVDTVLEDPVLLDLAYEALACRWRNSRTRGRKGTPVDVVIRLLVLKHMRKGSSAAARCGWTRPSSKPISTTPPTRRCSATGFGS